MTLVPTVFLVDPDSRFIASCRRLLEPHPVTVVTFDSPQYFFDHAERTQLGCIVSELQFNGANGIDFCQRLKHEGWAIPVLIHTAFGDVTKCSRAFRAGASDFLEKTVPPDLLLKRVLEILSRCRDEHARWQQKQSLEERVLMLTDREQEVLQALVSGVSMKEIATDFGTSFQSVARHRQRILAKLDVENDVALANMLRDYRWPTLNYSLGFDNTSTSVHD